MSERTIILDERDARRLQKANEALKTMQDIWDRTVRVLLPSYLEGETDQSVDIVKFDSEKKEITVKLTPVED